MSIFISTENLFLIHIFYLKETVILKKPNHERFHKLNIIQHTHIFAAELNNNQLLLNKAYLSYKNAYLVFVYLLQGSYG